MEKRLVKTAKEIFNEMLNNNTILEEYVSTDTDRYYAFENDGNMSVIRNIHDVEFYIYSFNFPYKDLYTNETFLIDITRRFVEHENYDLIPKLYDWFSTADKLYPPFSLEDVCMCDFVKSESIEDLYEDIYTAGEQWQNDSKCAIEIEKEKIPYTDVIRCRIEETCMNIKVYTIDEDSIFRCRVYPPFSFLKRDKRFFEELEAYYYQNLKPSYVSLLNDWKNSNGFFPFELVDIFGSEYPTYVEITYQDGKTEEMPCYVSDIIKHHSNNKNKASIIANIKKLDKIGCEINYKEIGLLGVSTINGEYYNLKTNKIVLDKDSISFQRLEDGFICKDEYIYSDICTEHLKRILLSMD